MSNFKMITGSAAISKAIDSIKRRGKTLDNDIHRAAVSCINHVKEHGDTTPVVQLTNAMPKSARRVALIDWFNGFAPMTVASSKTGVTVELTKGRKPEDFKITEAIDTPFWQFTKDKSTLPVTLDQVIARFEKAITKLAKESDTLDDISARKLIKAVEDARPVTDGQVQAVLTEGADAEAA